MTIVKPPSHSLVTSTRRPAPSISTPCGNVYVSSAGSDIKVRRGSLVNPVKVNTNLANTRWLISFPGVVKLDGIKKEEGKDGRMGRLGGLDTDTPWLCFGSSTYGTLTFRGRKFWSSNQFVPILASKKTVKVDDVFTGVIVFSDVVVSDVEVSPVESGGVKRTGGSGVADPVKKKRKRGGGGIDKFFDGSDEDDEDISDIEFFDDSSEEGLGRGGGEGEGGAAEGLRRILVTLVMTEVKKEVKKDSPKKSAKKRKAILESSDSESEAFLGSDDDVGVVESSRTSSGRNRKNVSYVGDDEMGDEEMFDDEDEEEDEEEFEDDDESDFEVPKKKEYAASPKKASPKKASPKKKATSKKKSPPSPNAPPPSFDSSSEEAEFDDDDDDSDF